MGLGAWETGNQEQYPRLSRRLSMAVVCSRPDLQGELQDGDGIRGNRKDVVASGGIAL